MKTTNLILLLLISTLSANAQFPGTPIMLKKTGKITLGTASPYIIASIYDLDYLPYTTPTAAASWDTAQAADGTTETTVINLQGTLTTTGVTINIPYTVTTTTTTLPAYTQTINVPAAYTQDGISRNLTLSYASQSLAVGTGYIAATLKAVGGTLNVKKLDIQTGVGNDNLGVLLAQFTYTIDSSGNTTNLDVRAIAGIPDRNFADANHQFIYVPIKAKDGKIWLNNNLGANYANVNKAVFNPAKQATSYTDYNAYGSLYQWGRYSDGHELANWTSSTTATLSSTTTTLATSTSPSHSNFIISTNSTYNYDWMKTKNNTLWQGVSGTNNPCPQGFRVPTGNEQTALNTAESITNSTTAASSNLHFSATGYRSNFTALLDLSGTRGVYWSTDTSSLVSSGFYFESNVITTATFYRGVGIPIRCVKN
jgi:hypothetical protein